jgi:hypothetical protein
MFRWLSARLGRKRRKPTDQQLAADEAIRREAEQERVRAEAKMAEERARIESAGGPGSGTFGGPGAW